MTLIDLVKELRSNGVLEYKGKLNGEEVFLRLMSPNGAQLEVGSPPTKEQIRKRQQRGEDGLTRDEQVALYGVAHSEDFS